MLHIIIPLLFIILFFFIFSRLKNNREKFEYTKYIPEKEKLIMRREIIDDKPKIVSEINPTNFNTGFIDYSSYKSSNQCNDKVLYPINGLDVNYGSKMPSGCKCQQFIQAP
jgi:hypothetical protein